MWLEDTLPLEAGVVAGLPLMFLGFINELIARSIQIIRRWTFADDSPHFKTINSIQNCFLLQHNLHALD